MKITPLILCGGSGTRLWPLSRKSYPKQFVELFGHDSLFEKSLARFSGEGFAPPVIVTNADFRFTATALMKDAGHGDGRVVIEPLGRNTAPATLAGAMLASDDPDDLVLLAPADHLIPDADAFRAAVMAGAAAAQAGQIVTFGITPTRPETGYGYLQLADDSANGATRVERFVEKPDAARAAEYLSGGKHLWNSGIFLFSRRVLEEAFAAHAPEFLEPVRAAVAGAREDLDFLRLMDGPWATLPDLSIDYAVMEKATNISTIPFDAGWSDVGDWDAVWQEMPRDASGVALGGDATAIDCRDTLLRSESEKIAIVGIGLTDVVAIAMDDAVLVADRSRAQEVKSAVAALKGKDAKQATQLPRDYRPWGWYESLVVGPRFQVKRIVVKPGAALSLQSHVHRSEHWVVVEGTARVTVGEEVKLISENQSVYIPVGSVHRMENPGKLPLVLIEVQTGAYLGEDDIVRYEDVYARE